MQRATNPIRNGLLFSFGGSGNSFQVVAVKAYRDDAALSLAVW